MFSQKTELGINPVVPKPWAYHQICIRVRELLKSTLQYRYINHDESMRFPLGATLDGKSGELLGHLTVSNEIQGNQQPSLSGMKGRFND